jgi:hypothetical protein
MSGLNMVKKSKKSIISLSCNYSCGPAGWSAGVRFIPLSQGYEVWVTDKDDETKWRKESYFNNELTWRSAAESLHNLNNVGLGGDLFSDIDVEGATSYMADMLAMCWVKLDNPAEEIINFLLERSDEDLEYLYGAHSSLISEEAILFIGELQEILSELKIAHLDFKTIAQKYGFSHLPAPIDLFDFLMEENYKTNEEDKQEGILGQIYNTSDSKETSVSISEKDEDHQVIEPNGLEPEFQKELEDWYTEMAIAAHEQMSSEYPENLTKYSGPEIETNGMDFKFSHHDYEVRIPFKELYDFDEDPQGLKFHAQEIKQEDPSTVFLNVYENLIKEAGYKGYWKNTNIGPIAAVFGNTKPVRRKFIVDDPYGIQ